MFIILELVGILLASLLAVALITSAGAITKRFILFVSDFDEWWNPVRPLPPEGQMFLIMKNSREGPFHMLLESVPGHNYDPETNVYKKIEQPEGDQSLANKESRKGFLGEMGLAHVGFNKKLFVTKIRYDKWERSPDSEKMVLVAKDRFGPAIYFQYQMATRVEEAETSDNIPINVIVSFTVQLTNPIRALFFAGGWEQRVTAVIQGAVREYVGSKDIDAIRGEKAKKGPKGNLIESITACNDDLKESGLTILNATFVEYDLSKAEEIESDLLAKKKAEAEGEAAIIRAERAKKERQIIAETDAQVKVIEAEADARVTVINAKAAADAGVEKTRVIEAEYKARSSVPQGAELAMAEAIRTTHLNVLSLGSQPGVVPTVATETQSKKNGVDSPQAGS